MKYTIYANGQDFLKENLSLLNTQPIKTAFFVLDAGMIEQTTSQNYAIRVWEESKVLLALHCQDVPLILFGDADLCEQLVEILIENSFEFDRVLADEDLCTGVLSHYCNKVGGNYKVNLRMDIMQCKQVAPFDGSLVEWATEADVEEIVLLNKGFDEDVCFPYDEQKVRERVQRDISQYAVIRKEGKIISLAKYAKRTPINYCVSMVYTVPQYRNQGYSRKVVSTITQKILDEGRVAYLFVDETNPISNGLYQKIGYFYISPQYEYQYIAD